MKHRELTDHIKGSFLKRQYLEAFLVQSAYFESLLKLYADYNFFKATGKKCFKDKVLIATRKNIDRFSLNDLINYLYRAGLISKEQKLLFNAYRERRNKMLHGLINEIGKDNFEKELEEICKNGNEIIESKEFIEMADIIDKIETPEQEISEEENSIKSNPTETSQSDIIKL